MQSISAGVILRNAPQVINQLKNLTHKENRRFTKFDIADFYPSISISTEGTWVKRVENSSFDATMEKFDGAEIYKMIGIYRLEKSSPLLRKKNWSRQRRWPCHN